MSTLSQIFNSIQHTLFPWLKDALDPLSAKEQKFVQVLSLMDLQTHMKGSGCPYAGWQTNYFAGQRHHDENFL